VSVEVLEVQPLLPAAADDPAVVSTLTDLINEVYREGEKGLWLSDVLRITPAEVAGLIRAGEIVVARIGGRIVGSVRVQQLDAGTGEFGVLAASPVHQGTGIGRRLVAFAEQHSRDAGCVTMQLELLVPRVGTHPAKARLAQWYGRLGYRLVRTGTLEDDFPHLAPLVAVPCDFLIYHKDLARPSP
jgi:GNAT superfamily N-acetyltransferase